MPRQLKLYLFILCAMFAFLTEALPPQAAEPESLEADSSTLIGWRLPSKIVLRGAIVVADLLREIAGGIELETDATAEDEGDPTPLMRAVVSTLSGLDGGRVEVRGRELSVVGIAEVKKIGGLKARIEGLTRRDVRIGELRIDPLDRAPYLWTASRSFNTLELSGFVADEGARAKVDRHSQRTIRRVDSRRRDDGEERIAVQRNRRRRGRTCPTELTREGACLDLRGQGGFARLVA
jgi:hypothetical protein